MSVLVIEPAGPEAEAVIELLVREGDRVGVVVSAGDRERWRGKGAYVAEGDPSDADLIYRTAQHARTIVLFDEGLDSVDRVIAAVVEAAPSLPEAPRVVLVSTAPESAGLEALRSSPLDFIVLVTGQRKRWGRGRRVDPVRVAAAVNAADDLNGDPRLELDLFGPDAWSKLGL